MQYFLCISTASIRFSKNQIFASFSCVVFFFNDKVERFHRATLFHISEGDVVPDNFLPVSLLVKWEKLKDFELRRRMHVVDRTNFLKKLKFIFINAEVLKADEVSV